MKWITLDKKLPEDQTFVLVTLRDGAVDPAGEIYGNDVTLAWFVDNTSDVRVDNVWHPHFYYGHDDFILENNDILAWMPLPEPYTAERESE